MKIILLCLSLLTINQAALAKTKNHKKKSRAAKTTRLSKEDAKELCLTNEGASITDEKLESCIVKTMKAGKFVK